MCWFEVHMIIEEWFKQTHYVSYFNNKRSVLMHNLTSKNIRHHVLADQLFWSGVHLVIAKWFKHTHCVRYFNNIHSICFTIWPVNKADNMYWLNNCVDLGFIWSLRSDLSRHTVLYISLISIWFVSWFDQWMKQRLCVG